MDDVNFFEEPIKKRGGKREGAGRPPDASLSAGEMNARSEYNAARAKKEKYLAEQAELKFKIESGAYVPRTEVRRASATAFQEISQTIRSIPDLLERKLALEPKMTELVGIAIDEALAALSAKLKEMHEKNYRE